MVTLKKKNENKYLALDDVDENKEFWKKYEQVWEGEKLRLLTIIIRYVFREGGKFYPQLFFDDALFESV